MIRTKIKRGPKPPPQIRRMESLGPLRKAHPASGATFNVQVVKGKMSEKCLVHACRALSIGVNSHKKIECPKY